MDDLISRQAAIDALCRGEGCGNICRRALEHLPTAEKKGKWIEHNPHKWGLGIVGIVFECSECGEKVYCEACNYCPNCGARMEE